MRIALIHIQLFVLVLLALAAGLASAAAGGMAGVLGAGAATGPAALGGVLIVGALFVAAAVALVAFALPLSLISAASLLFAVTAGYRYLRWSRWCGVAANAAGIAYFLILNHTTDIVGARLLAWLLAMPVANAVLFILVPRRPNYRLTRAAVTVAVPLLYAAPFGLLAVALIPHLSTDDIGACLVMGIAALANAFAFYFIFRTIPLTETINAALGRRLAIAALVAAAAQVVFPLGVPLAFATLLLLQLAEITLLHPREEPARGSVHFWAARVLGRLPGAETPAAAPAIGPGFVEAGEE